MRTLLFAGKNHRTRRKETIKFPPKEISFIPQQDINKGKKDTELSNVKDERNIIQKIRTAIFFGNFIPKKYLKNINAIYSPGKVVFNNYPWVVEIDNVAVLAYYKPWLLKTLKPIIKYKLKSDNCKSIICLSKAAKKGIINFFKDKNISKKCHVVYPYVSKNKLIKSPSKNTRFLFISTNYYLKGGKEVRKAFTNLYETDKNIKLIMITKRKDLTKKELEILSCHPGIELLEASFNKEDLYKEYYMKSDVFVLPTYQDSFGLVYLEALSCNLPIISCNSYNLPEIIEHGKNGYLIEPPIHYFKKDYLPNEELWKINITKLAKETNFPKTTKQIEHYMQKMLDEKNRNKMSINAEKIFKNKFIKKIRDKSFTEALKCVE